MTRPTSYNPKKRRIRSRLRERLDDLLAQKPLPVRQERLAAPQVRLLESRFVLDASAALVGLDALSSGWEAQSAEVQSDAPHGTAVASQEHMLESVEVSSTGPGHSFSEARQFASTGASNDALGLDLDLGFGSDLTSELNMSLAIAGPQADSMAGDSNSVEFEFGEVERSPGARFAADERATHVIEARDSEGLPLSLDDSEGESGLVVSLDFPQVAQGNDADVPGSGSDLMMAGPGQSNPDANEIVFIDAGVQDYETLVADFREGVEVLILEGTQDGVTQISQALEGRADLDAIHLVSHGSAGSLQLGSTEFSSDSMTQYAEALSQIGSSLTDSGDLMLYGCDVAQGEIGQAFISALATATDADIAASNDRTGNAGLSGDWELESSSGDVGTATLIDDTVMTGYAYVLAQPNVLSVEVNDTSITDSDAGNSFEVTVTFDQAMDTGGAFEPTLSFDPDVFVGGTLTNPSAGVWSVSDTVFTKTFDVVDVGVEVANVEIDVSGAQSSGSEAQTDYTPEAEFSIDTLNPTVTVSFVESSLTDGSPSSVVTFEFSEDVVGFDQTDLTPANGLLSGFSGTGSSYQATFTADDGVDGVGSVTVGTGYTDLLGNTGNGGSDTVTIDTENPTASVDLDATSLWDGSNSTALTITFSETPVGFDATADLTVTGGVLDTGSFDASNKVWTATYTATNGFTGTGTVLLAPASYTDAEGNDGSGDSDSVTIDTENPTVDVNIVDNELTDADDTSLVTFEFSEAVIGFDASDLSLVGGSISSFTVIDANSFTALFTATDGVALVGQVSVVGDYTDLAGNIGVAGVDTVDIDTLNPAVVVNVVESLLTDSNVSSLVTFTFSEDVSGFDVNDVTPSLGSISGFTAIDGRNYEATFTATDGVDANGEVVVVASYTDLAGNLGSSGSDAVAIDTLNPTVTVNVVESVLTDDNATSLVTFEFSEDVSGFDSNDVTPSFGSISGFIVVDGSNYQATFTATNGVDVLGQVAVVADYTDLAGNVGTTGLDTVVIDRLNPTVNVDVFENELTDAEPSSLVTFEFSEDVTGFDAGDLSTVGGSISDFAIVDANTYTALFTASDDVALTGSITVNGGYEDLNGNVGASGFDNVVIDRVNPTVVSVVRANADYTNAASVDFTVTFSENVTGVDVDGSDFSLVASVVGASIVSVSGSDAVYTVTVGTGSTGGSVGLALAATPTIQDAVGNDLTDTAISGANENYTIASTEVLLTGGDVSVADIREATADDLTLSVVGGNLIISSSSDAIAVGVGVTRISVSSVSVALANITGSNGVTVSTGGLDDIVSVEGVGRRLDIDGGSGTDTVQFQANAINTNGGDLLVNADFVTQDANASLDADAISLNVTGGNLELNAALSASGNLFLDVSGEVSQTLQGVVFAAGDTTVSANEITLDNASNDFQGVVNASGSGLVFVDSNGISLGDIDAVGAFSVTALSGAIDDGAADANGADVNVAGVATFSASGMIDLDDQWNDFGDQLNVDAQDFVLVAQGDVLLFDVDVDQLAITAVGNVSDGGTGSVLVAGNASFTGSAVVLGDNTGNLARFGSLTFNASGVVNVSEDGSMNVAGSSTAGAGLDLVSTDDVTLNASVTVVGDTSIIAGPVVGGITVNAKLNGSGTILLDAADEITISAAIDPTTVTLNADDD
ncbi:MAG: Ig-like domain-containing protein, partial [Rubripirellula sp.]